MATGVNEEWAVMPARRMAYTTNLVAEATVAQTEAGAVVRVSIDTGCREASVDIPEWVMRQLVEWMKL